MKKRAFQASYEFATHKIGGALNRIAQPSAAPAAAEQRAHSVFLSYSRKDEVQVLTLDAALAAAGDVDVLRDKEDIFPAEDWRARLEALIVAADAFVFCMSPDSLASDVVAWELSVAIRLSKRIVPVVLRGGGPRPPQEVARLNYVFLTPDQDSDAGLAKLREAITADLDWVREHTRIGELAQRWETHGRPRYELIRGAALEAAEAWLAAEPRDAPPPSTLHRAFIAASRQNAVRRQRIVVSIAIGVAVMALGLSALAYWQRGVAIAQRTEATARRLSAEAQVLLADPLADGTRPARDLLISQALSPSASAASALERTVRRLPPRRVGRIELGDAAAGAISFDPTGRWLALATPEETIFWDVETGTLRFRHAVEATEAPPDIAFTADGARALVIRRPEFAGSGPVAADVIDLDADPAAAIRVTGAFDATVEGDAVLLLQPEAEGVAVVDLARDAVVQRIAPGGAAVATARFSAPPTSLFAAAPSPMTPFAPGPARQAPLVVLADVEGRLSVAERGGGGAVRPLARPDGAAPIALDPDGGHLALRSPEAGDSVIDLTGDKPVWTARGGAKSFRAFIGGGGFVVVRDDAGSRIESLTAGVALQPSDARRPDWDLTAMTDLAEYNAIVSVAFAREKGLVVTGRSDGRIAVWRPGVKSRFGAWGALPMPNFERVASFDHGDAFGAQEPFWTGAQNLFVSDDGRYVASQSLGLQTNAVGGIVKLDPVIRIWDTRHDKETARLRPDALTSVVFAPDRPLMAVVERTPPAEGETAPARAITLWDVSALETVARETREALRTLTIDPTKAAAGMAAMSRKTGKRRKPQDGAPPEDAPVKLPAETEALLRFYAEAQGVWLGVDLKLRALPAGGGPAVVLDDFSDRAAAIVEGGAGMFGGALSAEDLLDKLAEARAAAAPDLPMALPLAQISVSGAHAFVAVDNSVRVYALGDRPRFLRAHRIGDAPPLQVLAVTGAPNGEAVAVMLADWSAIRSAARVDGPFLPAEMRIYRAGREALVLREPARLMQTPALPMLLDRIVAFGPQGRRIMIERVTLETEKTAKARMQARIALRALDADGKGDGAEVVIHSREVAPMQMMMMTPMGQRDGAAPVGAFDATGRRATLIQEVPDCPMQTVMTRALMPIQVSSCADRRATVTLYDAATGEARVTERFLLRPDKASPQAPLDPMTAMSMGMAGMAGPSLTSEVTFGPADGPPAIAVESRVVEMRQEPTRLDLTLERRRTVFAFDGADLLDAEACARLPDAQALLSPEAWAATAPTERYRPVCP